MIWIRLRTPVWNSLFNLSCSQIKKTEAPRIVKVVYLQVTQSLVLIYNIGAQCYLLNNLCHLINQLDGLGLCLRLFVYLRQGRPLVQMWVAISHCLNHLFFIFRKALNFLLPYAHGGVALREHSKSLLIKQCHEVRLAYRILAQKLCSNGFLPEPDLIYYVTHPEIKELIEKRSPTIVQKYVKFVL